MTARSQAGSYQSQLSASRGQAEGRQGDAGRGSSGGEGGGGVDARKRATVVSLRKEVHQLRLRVEALEAEALQAKLDDDRSTRAGLGKSAKLGGGHSGWLSASQT